MTFQQLKYINAIAKYGSFNGAAHHLFVSQSSISSSVKELEHELGITVFIRTCRGTELSPQGQEFMRYNSRLMNVLEEINDRYQPSDESQRVLFCTSSQHYLFFEDAFVELVIRQSELPYQLNYREGTFEHVLNDVASFRSEIGLIFKSKHNSHFSEKALREKNLAFHSLVSLSPSIIIRRGHPLAYKKSVSSGDLALFPFAVHENHPDSSFGDLNVILSGLKRRQTIRVMDQGTLLEVVCKSDAFTICAGILPEKYISRYISIPLQLDAGSLINIGWICRSDADLSETAEHFVALTQRLLDGYLKQQSLQR